MAYMEGINHVLSLDGIPGQPAPVWARETAAENLACGRFQVYANTVIQSIPHLSFAYLSAHTGRQLEQLFQQEFVGSCYRGYTRCICVEAKIAWKKDAVGLIDTLPAFSTYVGRLH